MSLTCECFDDYEWFYIAPDDYSLLETKRRRRCESCKQLIDLNTLCLEFECYYTNENGDEIYTADKYMCERCGDLFYSLDALGFCLSLGDDMRELVREYGEVYGK